MKNELEQLENAVVELKQQFRRIEHQINRLQARMDNMEEWAMKHEETQHQKPKEFTNLMGLVYFIFIPSFFGFIGALIHGLLS